MDERLGACDPVKPFSPEALAFPVGGKSKPIPVMVAVDPGDVIAEVLVMVKVSVLVCELNSQTTVAVEIWPEPTPTMLIVSARTLEVAAAITNTAAKEMRKRLNRGMRIPPWSSYLRKYNVLSSFAEVRSGGRTCGASAIPPSGVVWAE